jgi:hypothetical protein
MLGKAALAVAAMATSVNAEIFEFNRFALPGAKQLQVVYGFTIYGNEQTPGTIELMHDFKADLNGDEKGDTKKLDDVEFLLVKAENFHLNLDREHFCCSIKDQQDNKCPVANRLVPIQVGPSGYFKTTGLGDVVGGKNIHMDVGDSGMFYLAVANCGNINFNKESTMSGSVQARSSHGLLPGVDIHSLYFTGCMLAVYCALLLGWVFLCVRWKSQLFTIHHAISLVLILGLADMSVRYGTYSVRNISEKDMNIIEQLAHFGGLVKCVATLLVLLSCCLGWGTTNDSLGSTNITWMMLLGTGYVISVAGRIFLTNVFPGEESLLGEPNTPAGPMTFLRSFASQNTLYALPEAVFCGILMDWMYSSLRSLMASLLEQKQIEKYSIFRRLHLVIVCSLIVLVLGIMGDVLFLQNLETHTTWKGIWVFDEAMPQSIYLIVVGTIMYLWAPNENFQQYAFSQQIGYDDAELDEIIGSNIELGEMTPREDDGEIVDPAKDPAKYLE